MTFTKNAFDAIIEALDIYGEINDVKIHTKDSWRITRNNEPVKFLVNWWALGDVEPEDAEEYAWKICKAAELCRALNEAQVQIDEEAPEGITDSKTYDAFVDYYVQRYTDHPEDPFGSEDEEEEA